MGRVASKGQLRMTVVRCAMVTVPLVLFLGFASGRSVSAGSDNRWYAALAKPAGTPPDWAFPVAWSLIYVCLGLALALVLAARRTGNRGAGIAPFVVTLALATAWMPVFFGAHLVRPALGIALGMVAAGIVTAVLFGQVRRLAAWLMMPFLVWTSYAVALTWGIDRLNPDAANLAPGPAASQVTDDHR